MLNTFTFNNGFICSNRQPRDKYKHKHCTKQLDALEHRKEPRDWTVKVSKLDKILISTALISFSVKLDSFMLNKSSFVAVEYCFFLALLRKVSIKNTLKILLSEATVKTKRYNYD